MEKIVARSDCEPFETLPSLPLSNLFTAVLSRAIKTSFAINRKLFRELRSCFEVLLIFFFNFISFILFSDACLYVDFHEYC